MRTVAAKSQCQTFMALNRSFSYRKSRLTNKAQMRRRTRAGTRNHIAAVTSMTAVGRVK
jgi:hypothetical protein